MLKRILCIVALAAFSVPAHAGNVVFEVFGVVSSGTAPSGPFMGTTAGMPVHIRYEVFTPGVDAIPGQWTDYTIDLPTLLVEIGTASTTVGTGAPVVGIVNAFPVADRVQQTATNLLGGNKLDMEFGECTGTMFSSTDVLANLGTWPASIFCSWNFVVYGAGAFIDLEPQTFSISLVQPGEPFCFGDGTLLDHTTPCPCGNNGAPGRGCGHSFDAGGAKLGAQGDVALDTVVLGSSFEPVSSFTLFMQHSNPGDTIFHDGVLCAGNPLIRLRGRSAVAGEAFFPNSNFAQDSTTTLSIRGGTFPGSGATMRYAAWYRNASSTFCPPATANVTNGWVITW
jgi:hypothetical protein